MAKTRADSSSQDLTRTTYSKLVEPSSRELLRTTREEHSFQASINNSFQASSNNINKGSSCSSLTREPETRSHSLQKCSADSPL